VPRGRDRRDDGPDVDLAQEFAGLAVNPAPLPVAVVEIVKGAALKTFAAAAAGSRDPVVVAVRAVTTQPGGRRQSGSGCSIRGCQHREDPRAEQEVHHRGSDGSASRIQRGPIRGQPPVDGGGAHHAQCVRDIVVDLEFATGPQSSEELGSTGASRLPAGAPNVAQHNRSAATSASP
jgi:hypothetical protein